MSGYVRIHRDLIGHAAFRDDQEALAFAWMVIQASWRSTRVRYKGRAFALNRGQLTISQRDMASRLKCDKAWVERLWKRLRAEAMIAVAYEAGAAVITICNYDKFQGFADGREAAHEADHEADARQTQGTEQVRQEGKKRERAPLTPRAGGSDRGAKIDEDWAAPPVRELPPQARSCADQWTQEAYAAEAEAFRNYWLGESGARARKSDWRSTWANRVVQIHSKIMRDQSGVGRGGKSAGALQRLNPHHHQEIAS